ncbi:hypothetical protein Droror1_Dr00025087, partial [Drosera rotundifolia]
ARCSPPRAPTDDQIARPSKAPWVSRIRARNSRRGKKRYTWIPYPYELQIYASTPRSISSLTTPFLVSGCLGIHRTPFFV